MSSPIRLVRHLRLRADSERAIHRAALLLEDALRIASLPDEAGRIVLVRRFALGRIDTHAAPQTLALTLERAIARMTAACVYVDDESAAGALAVWFRDALDAHTKLALRLANGDPVDAWYWPLAVAVWRPHSTVPVALRRIMLSLATLPEAPVALPRWTAVLASAGYIEKIAAALRADDIVPLARAARVRIPTPVRNSKPVADGPVTHDFSPTLRPRIWPPIAIDRFDLRRALLRALLRAAQVQAGKASGWTNPVVGAVARSATMQDRSVPDALNAGVSPPVPVVSSKDSSRRAASSERTEGSPAFPGPTLARRSEIVDRDRDDIIIASTSDDLRIDSRAGGLLFLIPVLQRLGFQKWLEAQPDWMKFDIARRMMAIVLSRLRIAFDDPAWSLAACRCSTKRGSPRFIAPVCWREGLCAGEGDLRLVDSATGKTLWDASGRLLLGAWTDVCPRSLGRARRSAGIDTAIVVGADRVSLVSNAWLVACRRWLRRVAGLGVASLVMRQGSIDLTATHVDAFFRLSDVDIRVRRAGLDFDPGWVPWYGRVISFHYTEESTWPAALSARGTPDDG